MNVKRVLTAIIGLPVVLLVILFANKYIMDVVFAIIAIIAMHEYINTAKNKNVHIIKWISYLVPVIIAFIHVIPEEIFKYIAIGGIPTLLLILFLHVIISDMKITYQDIAFTLIGILYVVGFIIFVPLIFGIDKLMGKIYIGYVIMSAWGTDIPAYVIGRRIGKTKFSKVSPNKSVEGCIAGTLGAIIFSNIFTLIVNYFLGLSISYVCISIIALVLSLIGQIGDFAASVIKRYFEVKDFSNLFPGHGGMIDRIDSVIFIAPFAYLLFTLLI